MFLGLVNNTKKPNGYQNTLDEQNFLGPRRSPFGSMMQTCCRYGTPPPFEYTKTRPFLVGGCNMLQPLLKNISQNGNLPYIVMKIKHIGNHHPVLIMVDCNYKPQLVSFLAGFLNQRFVVNLWHPCHIVREWWRGVQSPPKRIVSRCHLHSHDVIGSLGKHGVSKLRPFMCHWGFQILTHILVHPCVSYCDLSI